MYQNKIFYFNKLTRTFIFFKVDISLIMHDPYLKLYICIGNIVVEGTVSQILYIGPGSFLLTYIE